jgi:hypothetical protein
MERSRCALAAGRWVGLPIVIGHQSDSLVPERQHRQAV